MTKVLLNLLIWMSILLLNQAIPNPAQAKDITSTNCGRTIGSQTETVGNYWPSKNYIAQFPNLVTEGPTGYIPPDDPLPSLTPHGLTPIPPTGTSTPTPTLTTSETP